MIGAAGGKIGFYGATPVNQPSGADQAAVTIGNTEGEIGGLTISDLICVCVYRRGALEVARRLSPEGATGDCYLRETSPEPAREAVEG